MNIQVRNTIYQIPTVMIIMGIFFTGVAGLFIYNFTPQKQASDQAYYKQYDELSDRISHMDCSQLQKIRLDSISGKPFDAPYGEHWGQIRDTYNALSCGNHWGIWED